MSKSFVRANKARRHVENYSAFAKSYKLERASIIHTEPEYIEIDNKDVLVDKKQWDIPVNPNPNQPTVYQVCVSEKWEGMGEEKFFLSYEKAKAYLEELKKKWGGEDEYHTFSLGVLKFND